MLWPVTAMLLVLVNDALVPYSSPVNVVFPEKFAAAAVSVPVNPGLFESTTLPLPVYPDAVEGINTPLELARLSTVTGYRIEILRVSFASPFAMVSTEVGDAPLPTIFINDQFELIAPAL